MNNTLLILTTAGRLHWLKDAVEFLEDSVDVLVVDDATPKEIGIEEFCKEHNLHYITKSKPKGLTNSWNRGYQFFLKHKYTFCILSNDDVRFGAGSIIGLRKALGKFHLVGPLSNRSGDATHQGVKRYVKSLDFGNANEVQKVLEKQFKKDPFKPCQFVNGFCFGFSKVIKRFQFSSGHLFNPKNINVGNEHDLAQRVRRNKGRVAVCKIAYVYHRKMGTYYELNWKKISGYRERLWR